MDCSKQRFRVTLDSSEGSTTARHLFLSGMLAAFTNTPSLTVKTAKVSQQQLTLLSEFEALGAMEIILEGFPILGSTVGRTWKSKSTSHCQKGTVGQKDIS